MTLQLENVAPIRIASLVSNEAEDEGLLALIRQSGDIAVDCHAIISFVSPTLSLFQSCDWKKIGVIVMILPVSIMEDAVIAFTRQLPSIPLAAVINSSWQEDDISRILQAGVEAITASMRATVIVNVIRLAYYHAGTVDIDMFQKTIRSQVALPPHAIALSPLDIKIWSLVAEGYSNLQIAAVMGISLSRTKHRIKHIFRYLGVHHRTEAIKLYSNIHIQNR